MRLIGDDTNATWRHFGAADPYYGVLSNDDFRKHRLDDNVRRVFFESGEQEISELMAQLKLQCISGRRGQAIDFGCGVGRLLLPLSSRFESVLGIDISPHMLAETTANAERQGKLNVSVSDQIPVQANFDLVHSLCVLQHIDPEQGIDIIFRLWECLAPGGILCVQVPIRFGGSTRGRLFRAARKVFPLVQIPLNIARGHPWNDPGMQMNVYDLNRISFGLFDRGARFISLLRKDSSINYAGAYIISLRGEPN